MTHFVFDFPATEERKKRTPDVKRVGILLILIGFSLFSNAFTSNMPCLLTLQWSAHVINDNAAMMQAEFDL